MLIQINNKTRIVSNTCGGFDLEKLYVDKKTGEPKLNKDKKEIWRFTAFMPKLESLLMVAIEEGEMVSDRMLEDCERIVEAIRQAKEEVIAAVKAAQ